MRKRHPIMVAGAVCAALAVGFYAPTGAVADPDRAVEAGVPAGFHTWDEVMETQSRLNAAADRLGSAATGHDGFAGITVPTADRQVRLYWKGDVPGNVSALAAELNGAGTQVVTLPAAHSSLELREAREWLKEVDDRRADVTITSIGPLPGGAGLDIDVAEPAHSGGAVLRQNIGGVHLDIATGRAPQAMDWDSWHDQPDWSGGSKLRLQSGYCTSAFGATRRSDGQDVLLTAGHCGDEGDEVRIGGGEVVGQLTDVDMAHDTALIPVIGSEGLVWADTKVPGTKTREVSGVLLPRIGNFICASGANSGERCGAVIHSVDVTLPTLGFTNMVFASMPDKTNLLGQGDSGGPVYALDGDDQALGVGIISASIGHPVSCTGSTRLSDGTPRTCNYTLYFAPLVPTLQRYGLDIKLTP